MRRRLFWPTFDVRVDIFYLHLISGWYFDIFDLHLMYRLIFLTYIWYTGWHFDACTEAVTTQTEDLSNHGRVSRTLTYKSYYFSGCLYIGPLTFTKKCVFMQMNVIMYTGTTPYSTWTDNKKRQYLNHVDYSLLHESVNWNLWWRSWKLVNNN